MDEDDENEFGASVMAIASETTEAQKEFDMVLEQLRETEGMKIISDVYTKLYDMYYKSRDDLAAKDAEMEAMKIKMSKFDDTISQYQAETNEANKNMETLKKEMIDARKMADAMHARELHCVETLESMKRTLVRVEKELEARKKAGDDEAGAGSAAKEKEKFEKEKQKIQNELDNTKIRLGMAISLQEEFENRATAAEDTIRQMEEQIEDLDGNIIRAARALEAAKMEANGLKKEIEKRSGIIQELNNKISKLEKSLERRDNQIKVLFGKVDKAVADQEAAIAKATQMTNRYERLAQEFEKAKNELVNFSSQIKAYKDDRTKLRNEMAKLTKQNTIYMNRYSMLEQSKAGVELDRDTLRQQVSTMERDIELSRKQAEADRREIENLSREKDILNKNIQKVQLEAAENVKMLIMADQRRASLEHEIEMNTKQIGKQRLLIRQYEKEKDRMLEEAIALNEKIDEITDEVRLRNADIADLNKVLREEGINTRKLTASLDACRAELNMLQKNHTETLDEIQDMKQKLKMQVYQIEQMKEDITSKEVGLKSCEAMLFKCNKKCEMLRAEILSGQNKLSEARADIAALKQEEARLNRIVNEGDAARAKLLKELEGIMNERDVVGAQLVRRNDEISLLYEKIRILENTLHRGERQYEQRLEDIRLLRLEILRLRKEKNLLSKGIENMTDLRLEVFNLERELGRERLRVRALEEALETPLNVHRWRKLQGTDPDLVHLADKLRLTQKKVVVQSEMLVMRDRELKQTRNLYSAVKDMLALQPSPEIQQTLNRTQKALTARTSKLKCLIAELNMREQQVSDLRKELDKAYGELISFKKKYYEMKHVLDVDEARKLKVLTPPALIGVQSCECVDK